MEKNKAWIITADMGYGHQRTAYPLRDLSSNGVINANNYSGIPEKDRLIWQSSRSIYEFISNIKKIPLIGDFVFSIFDQYQKIRVFYPKRDLSRPSINLKNVFSLIKKGWGENLIKTLSANPMPLINTFFTPAFMAEYFNYPSSIYCIICDADISRSWVDLKPHETKIKYFAPCDWARDRLRLYGVPEKSIFLTGYPLPKENVGERMEIAKKDLSFRLLNLDPKKGYRDKYHKIIEEYIGILPDAPDHILTIMFSIGGAGAQKGMCCKILRSLRKEIKEGKIKVILSAGIKERVRDFLLENVRSAKLEDELGAGVEILFEKNIKDYFREFNQRLHKTDILWTKPSELSFYSALGLPIIIAPTVGSQEDFNKKWLLSIGSGVVQGNLNHTGEWLFDLINDGRLAESAMEGFVEIEKMGTYNIERIVSNES